MEESCANLLFFRLRKYGREQKKSKMLFQHFGAIINPPGVIFSKKEVTNESFIFVVV